MSDYPSSAPFPRTDLALELAQPYLKSGKLPRGLRVHTRQHGAVEITCVQIDSLEAAQQLHKPCGKYITIQTPAAVEQPARPAGGDRRSRRQHPADAALPRRHSGGGGWATAASPRTRWARRSSGAPWPPATSATSLPGRSAWTRCAKPPPSPPA